MKKDSLFLLRYTRTDGGAADIWFSSASSGELEMRRAARHHEGVEFKLMEFKIPYLSTTAVRNATPRRVAVMILRQLGGPEQQAKNFVRTVAEDPGTDRAQKMYYRIRKARELEEEEAEADIAEGGDTPHP